MSIFKRPAKDQRRVVVTGMGMLSPVGNNVEDSWTALISGKSGIAPITLFDASNFDVKIAGEVKNFAIDNFVPKKEQKKMDRFIHFAVACAKMAIEDSGLKVTEENAARIGAIVGVGIGGLPMIQEQYERMKERGPTRISPFFIPAVITNLASGQISIMHGLKGLNYSVTSACATGAHSIGEAYNYIRNGTCLAMIAGGAESAICELSVGGFNAMKALSTRNSDPQKASRPFDKDRDGFVIAEGGAVLVLEDMEYAKSRGAKIYGEVLGYGLSSDAYHIASPTPDGNGAFRAMEMALRDAQISPDKINYINAHGTSTPMGDEIESQAVRRLMGPHASQVWVSSTKSMTGHALGGAGSIESVICLKALQTGVVPPTINLEHPGEGCDLDYVPLTAREKKLNYVMNNSFGFGGTNASLIFAKI
ncbi:MAG: beta-ketoacyl-[acyl-carrier-protein] synthase II [Proteobacteria bacterium SG_bin7]|nr:MAG: beta-ketoacyl-[acyl-carrier-protein] synthase II [Proteobacteria bacterium SG_bin7]